jgi:hypothetical protein
MAAAALGCIDCAAVNNIVEVTSVIDKLVNVADVRDMGEVGNLRGCPCSDDR